MQQHPLTSTETMIHALWLVDLGLVDRRCTQYSDGYKPSDTDLRIRMQQLVAFDERVTKKNITAFLQQSPSLRHCLARLCQTVCDPQQGIPLIRPTLLSRRLIRVIDPDILICLCHLFYPASNDRYDWSAVPLRLAYGAEHVLNDGSVDTHIHLGGALPPLFYWVALMSCNTPINMMGAFPETRGYASKNNWMTALTRALRLRYQLAVFVNNQSQHKGLSVFQLNHLTTESTAHWEHCEYAEIRDQILDSVANLRLDSNDTYPGFTDPLANLRLNPVHYAAGERRLLCGLNQYLNLRPVNASEHAQITNQLLDYLRIRNAFHQILVHDHGADGLMRFIETFGRRRFFAPRRIKSRRTHVNQIGHQQKQLKRARRQRKRYRGKQATLERFRMRIALDAQLIDAFDGEITLPSRYAPPRGIEMRVSIPTGRLLKPLMRAWLEGFRDHLNPDVNKTGTSHTQMALLFHLIKRDNQQQTADEALELTRKLGCMLKDYPGLRPFIIGLDAAGDERSAAPRTFARAFHSLRAKQANLRIPTNQPAIRLGWTYHVGEDVDDLLTGLRHLDEAATLLLGAAGGRLGHALALGDDPARFYQQRGGQTELSLGCHLLDLVWAHGCLTRGRKPKHIAWIESRIRNQVARSPSSTSPNQLGIADCFHAMQLDALTTNACLQDTELLVKLLPDYDAESLMQQSINLSANKAWIKMVKKLQSILRKRLARRRICIEANPTSNLLIGHYTDYSQLPYQTLINDELALSINTDDPGLFMTSLPGEFSAIYNVLAQNMSHRKVLEWLAARQFDARQSSFINAQTRAAADLIIDKDEFDKLFVVGRIWD